MIQFKIAGQPLELAEGTKAQLVRKNGIFAFDSIEVERSVAFDIPATPKNNLLLGFANNYHGRGASMRVKIEAEMTIGVVAKEGYLCIIQYDCEKKTYKATFIFGQLLGLQKLKNAGKMSEMGITTDKFVDSDSPTVSPPSSEWSRVRYKTYDANPSMSVRYLFDLLAQRPELPRITLPDNFDNNLRIIKAKVNGYNEEQSLKSSLNPERGSQPSQDPPTEPWNLQAFDPLLFETVNAHFMLYTGVQQYWLIQGLRALTDVAITIPHELSNQWFMQKSAITTGEEDFYGGYWWEEGLPNQPEIIHGEPLGGKTIELKEGDEFYFVNLQDFVNTSAGGLTINGWRFNQGYTFPHDIKVRLSGTSRWFLKDNLPAITPIELCKIVAATTGTVIRYSESDGVFFDTLAEMQEKELKEVIKKTSMDRTFSDYAQRNIIRTKDEEPIEVAYTIDNETLAEEKVLQDIPLSSGTPAIRDYQPTLNIGEEDTVATSVPQISQLQRIELKKNGRIQEFCDASTSLKVTCRMDAFAYSCIKDTDLFLYDDAVWGWTDATWNNGVAEITIAQRAYVMINNV